MNAKILFITLLILILGGLFLWLRPDAATAPVAETQLDSTVAEVEAIPTVVEIGISKGHRSSGPETITVNAGESVVLRFSSDENAEIHLHGYDRTLNLGPGETGEISLLAEHSGRFEYELHGHGSYGHAVLGVLEVLPE